MNQTAVSNQATFSPTSEMSGSEIEVFPLVGIPIECEDQPIHGGENPCGDPNCYCAIYGYEVMQ